MREYLVRMVIRTNDLEPDHPAAGRPPYHSDQEMPQALDEWIRAALEDRDDSPHVVWAEYTLRVPPAEHRHDFVGDEDECVWPGCELTYGEYRQQKAAGS